MIGFDRILYVLLTALVAMLPFEFRLFPMLSNLQWLFIGVAVIALPVIVRERTLLLQNKLVRAAFLFMLTQWVAAAFAPEFGSNAAKGAIRVASGFILLCATLALRERKHILYVWSVAAVIAAVYAMLDYGRFGLPHLFREEDFFLGSVARLSGSFEYPNTAAAYFALSLPIVWSELKSRWFRIAGFLVVASALMMTYSRGAGLATLFAFVAWSVTGKKRAELQIAISFGMLFLAFLIFNRDIYRRFSPQLETKDFSAQYEPEYNFIREHPNASADLRIHVRNTGTTMWTPKTSNPFSLSYRLYDAEKKMLVRKAIEHTVIPTLVRPQEAVDIHAAFRTPDKAGVYLLTWDLFSEESGWFSGRGVYPGIVEVHVDPDNAPSSGQTDTSRWLQRDTAGLFVAKLPYSRTELWKAAIDMARKHPFLGVGPDNFRLLYGRQYGATRWDTKIRANNLYLELLSGSGLVGLAAFCVMMAVVRWKPNASSIGVAIFLIHGLVDTFLMTTPIYFAFWILLGHVCGRSPASQDQEIRDLKL
jgi:O-antigen ligase/polysaccharide polymerase Wzy-like membrane protein/Ig-like domain-containing protein